jgi:hypothetical protein
MSRQKATHIVAAQQRSPRQSSVLVEISAENAAERMPGVPLKVVSTFTVIFALVCLGAFLAGRTNLPEEIASTSVSRVPTATLAVAQRSDAAFANPTTLRASE